MCQFSNTLPKIEFIELSKSGSIEFRQVLSSFMEPKLNEKVSFGTYEVMKGKGLLAVNEAYVRGKAKIHGIPCFETVSTYVNFKDNKKYEVISFDRIVDRHIQSLAYIEEYPNGCREFYTFKDKHFMEHWATGENNCGMEINLKSKGIIACDEDKIFASDETSGMYDIVGEYEIKIYEKTFHTVRLVLMAAENQVSDFFIDINGKEIMHRFFIPDDGFNDSMKENPYSKQFPEAYSITVNNRKCICTTYVIPDYVLL